MLLPAMCSLLHLDSPQAESVYSAARKLRSISTSALHAALQLSFVACV
jgi:hypothetical protein